jgi:cytochrome c-type biogenesis protein
MKIRYKKPEFVYLGDEFVNGALILSNHEGTDAPMALEIYCDKPIRMWGSYEMNSDVVKLYKYQTKIYYHEKKHWNIHLARLFCLIASPITRLFYAGFDLISVYRDTRLIKTLRESVRAIESGDNIVVFPEDSTKGYLAELEGFHEGFVLLAELCLRRGIDLPIYVSYFAGHSEKEEEKRVRTVFRVIAFVLGFTLVFTALGVFAGTLGRLLSEYKTAVNVVSGSIVIIFGLSFLGLFQLPFFKGIKRGYKVSGLTSAFVFGVIYSVSLTPCVGAFLGSALMLASSVGGAFKGAMLLLVYSLGLGIPFILSAIFLDKLSGAFGVIKRNYKIINGDLYESS